MRVGTMESEFETWIDTCELCHLEQDFKIIEPLSILL